MSNSVRTGRVAAFPVEIDGQEGIGVAAEFGRSVIARAVPKTSPLRSAKRSCGSAMNIRRSSSC